MVDTTTCSPGKGKTLLGIGQDLFSIQEYVNSQYNFSLHDAYEGSGGGGNNEVVETTYSSFVPAIAMFYTDLDKLQGLNSPTDYGSGVEFANGIISVFPDSKIGLQIGLWLNGTYGCNEINTGRKEEQLRVLNDYLDSNQYEAVFLRIGYEFDNPFFGYSNDPHAYADAFRYIVRFLRDNLSDKSLMKVKFVWHSWAAPRSKGLSLQDFYPGDEFVDWIGISLFQQLFPWSTNGSNAYVNWGGDASDVEHVLEFAAEHRKPTMIAESTPFGGINLNDANTVLFNDTNPWDRWFGKVLSLIETYDIDMWSYINCDWDSQPMWHNVGFGDTRLSSNAEVMHKWQHYILESKGSQTFLMSDSLSCDFSSNLPTTDIVASSFHRNFTVMDDLRLFIFVLVSLGSYFILRSIIFARLAIMKPSQTEERQPILGPTVSLMVV